MKNILAVIALLIVFGIATYAGGFEFATAVAGFVVAVAFIVRAIVNRSEAKGQ
jgi:hypothetical protein